MGIRVGEPVDDAAQQCSLTRCSVERYEWVSGLVAGADRSGKQTRHVAVGRLIMHAYLKVLRASAVVASMKLGLR